MPEALKCTFLDFDGATISDWSSFHSAFKEKMGFPEFYGMNMNAWIDCMTCVDHPTDAMTSVHAPEGGALVIKLRNAKSLKRRCGEIYEALIECAAFVNHRRIEKGEAPVLILSFYD